MTSLLTAENLQALSAQGQRLSPKISFELLPGEVLFWTGDNGAGKSTLLKSLLRLHSHQSGDVRWNCSLDDTQYLPQLGTLTFHIPLSLQDLLPEGQDGGLPLLQGIDLNKKWNTASGGERQRVLMAAVLLKKPKVLVLDEPFNHVDQATALVLEKALQDYMKDLPQSSMILVSHRALVQSWPLVRFVEIA